MSLNEFFNSNNAKVVPLGWTIKIVLGINAVKYSVSYYCVFWIVAHILPVILYLWNLCRMQLFICFG